jgi:hypothetical protein
MVELNGELVDKLSIIKIGSYSYYGIVQREKSQTTITDAVQMSGVGLKEYVAKINLGDTKTITVGGGETFTTESLSVDEKLQLKMYIEKFTEVKKMAIKKIENDIFLGSFK